MSSEWVAVEIRCRRDRFREESRRVRGDGASSSSLSLQPRPVVSPTPSLSVSPARCRSFRIRLSRSSLPSPVRSSLEWGESRPCFSIRLGRGVCKSRSASSPRSLSIDAMSGLDERRRRPPPPPPPTATPRLRSPGMGGSGCDGGRDGGGFADSDKTFGPSGMCVGGAGNADNTVPSNMEANGHNSFSHDHIHRLLTKLLYVVAEGVWIVRPLGSSHTWVTHCISGLLRLQARSM